MKKKRPFFHLLALLIAVLVAQGCRTPHLEKDPDQASPVLSGTCPEQVSGITGHVVRDPEDFPGWDLVVEVFFEVPPAPPEGCECIQDEFCVYLRFPQSSSPGYTLALAATPTTLPVILTPNSNHGYVDHTPAPFSTNPHLDYAVMVEGTPAPLYHQVCNDAESFLIFVNFGEDGVPSGVDPEEPIAKTSGICIVDNVGN